MSSGIEEAARWRAYRQTSARRHVAYYLEFVEKHDQISRSDYDTLEGEHANLLAAMGRAYQDAQWASVRRFALLLASVGGYLNSRDYLAERRILLQHAVYAAEIEENKHDVALFTCMQASLIWLQDLAEAQRLAQTSLTISKELEDRQLTASALNQLGVILIELGKYAEAQSILERSARYFEEIGDRSSLTDILSNLGRLSQDQGDYPAARHYYSKGLKIAQDLRGPQNSFLILHQMGVLSSFTGNILEAEHFFKKSLEISSELGHRGLVAVTQQELGRLAHQAGNYAEAQRVYQQCLDSYEKIGNKAATSIVLNQLGLLAQERGDYAKARRFFQQSLDVSKELGREGLTAVTLLNLGGLALDAGNYAQARCFYRQSLALSEKFGMPIRFQAKHHLRWTRLIPILLAILGGVSFILLANFLMRLVSFSGDQKSLVCCLSSFFVIGGVLGSLSYRSVLAYILTVACTGAVLCYGLLGTGAILLTKERPPIGAELSSLVIGFVVGTFISQHIISRLSRLGLIKWLSYLANKRKKRGPSVSEIVEITCKRCGLPIEKSFCANCGALNELSANPDTQRQALEQYHWLLQQQDKAGQIRLLRNGFLPDDKAVLIDAGLMCMPFISSNSTNVSDSVIGRLQAIVIKLQIAGQDEETQPVIQAFEAKIQEYRKDNRTCLITTSVFLGIFVIGLIAIGWWISTFFFS